jgi:excisionase family DNA binding protein
MNDADDAVTQKSTPRTATPPPPKETSVSTATPPLPQALTVKEVMAALKVSRTTVYDLFRSRQLDSFTIGRSRRVDATAVATYMTNRTEENRNG